MGENYIESGAEDGTISLEVVKKTNADVLAEVAWLVLYECSYLSGLSCTIAAGEGQQSVVRLQIEDSSGGGGGRETSGKGDTRGNMPTWIWYPIAAGILVLAGLAAFGYMYYNKRKLAEQQLQQREEDLAQAQELDAADNFGGIGDNLTFNPIATAGTQDIATGGDYIDKQLAKQQKHAEFAQVDVEKEVWRQDFGQVKAEKHSET